MNFMGVDVGTSGCKAVVFSEAGEQQAVAYREYDLILADGGRAELETDDVMAKCFDAIREATGKVDAGSVKALGVSSQGEAFAALDSEGRALCGGMVSSDTRAADYVGTWSEQFGAEKLYQITGQTPHTMYTVFKLLWIKDHLPEIWEQARKFLCFEDLLACRLGVDPAISWSLAARTMMFDVRRHTWDADILAAVGLAPGMLARPLPSGSVTGVIPASTASELGLAEGAFVVTAGHDQPCGALGAGITRPGMAMYATGTVECISPAFEAPVLTPELYANNLCTYDHTVQGMYTTVAFSLTGGNLLKWFRNEFGAQEVAQAEQDGVDAYTLLLEAASDEPTPVMALPYFTPSGTPHFDLTTPGAIVGLRLGTTRGEILRALLEGVAFEMRQNLEILAQSGCEVNELRAIGGGAKSLFWTQLKADVIGKPITTLNVTEAASMGAAMLACAAETGQSVASLAEAWVKPADVCEPDPDRRDWYDAQSERYRKLYQVMRDFAAQA